MTIQPKNLFKDIRIYLDHIGVNHLEIKSSYEIARFMANEEVCVIYGGKKGVSGSNELAKKIVSHFEQKKLINVQSERRKTLKERFYLKLLERDGDKCFYTGKEMTTENSSIEHLIPLSKGGKNNLDNLVLCLKEENAKMANLPLVEKIKYKIKNLPIELITS